MWKRFLGKPQASPASSTGRDRAATREDSAKDVRRNIQLPNNLVHPAFGEVNVLELANGKKEVVATILMDPVTEGTQTGVALDGSSSMREAFGNQFTFLQQPPEDQIREFRKQGFVKEINSDGQQHTIWTMQALRPLEARGYVRFSTNDVEPTAHKIIPYLAEKLDEDGGCTVIYWACGPRGDSVQEVGDLRAGQVLSTRFVGPDAWGSGTHLVPAMRYFLDRFRDARFGFYVFITDGHIDDLEAVKQYTLTITQQIANGTRNPAKGVLIGVGNQIDEDQMEVLDDLPSPYDFWDHKIAATMRDLRDIFAEVVDENTRVADFGKIYDDKSVLIKDYSDGVPAILRFEIPYNAHSFRLELPGGDIVQTLRLT